MESTWLNNDLSEIKHAELSVQLESIFGKTDADQFLNPTIQEKSQTGSVQHQFTKRAASAGAHALWYSLRSNSKRQLLRETKNTPEIYTNAATPNKGLLNRIEEYKHKLELMHRISQLNERKTKQLLQRLKLPSIVCSELDVGPSQFFIMDKIDVPVLPAIQPKMAHSKKSCKVPKEESKTLKPVCEGSDIKFLSEKDCKVAGQFRDRLKLLGVESNVGIMKPEQMYRLQNQKHVCKNVPFKSKSYQQTKKHERRKLERGDSVRQSQSWPPLTLNALVEYTKTIPTHGLGENSDVPMWQNV